jgi:hypothetical protein
MWADTERKQQMGRRFAIVIGAAAAGVMALGAQTAVAGGDPVDSTPPDLQVPEKKKQEFGNAVKVKASCGDEACTAGVDGWLEWRKSKTKVAHGGVEPPPNADLGPGETTTLKLRLKNRGRRARKALDRGQKVKANVAVYATDAAGNYAHAYRTIRLVK